MGQYHYIVNLTKREFLHPHQFGNGLKLMEFGNSQGGVLAALAMLLMPERSWEGDRIAIVGDYAEDGDLPPEFHARTIFGNCMSSTYPDEKPEDPTLPLYRDISPQLCETLTRQYNVTFSGGGWRDIVVPEEILATERTWDGDERGLIIVNLDQCQFLDPWQFGSSRHVSRLPFARAGGVLTALAVLLAVSNGRGGGDFHDEDQHGHSRQSGRWGGARLAIMPIPMTASLPHGMIDISPVVRAQLAHVEGYDYREQKRGQRWSARGRWEMAQA